MREIRSKMYGFCMKIFLLSAQNIRPAGDAESLPHIILYRYSIIPHAIVRGQQEFEDATAAPPEDLIAPAGGNFSIALHIIPSDEDDGPMPSILEHEVFNGPIAPHEDSRSPVSK